MYPEFEKGKTYRYDEIKIGEAVEVRVIEFDRFYPLIIFTTLYINNN